MSRHVQSKYHAGVGRHRPLQQSRGQQSKSLSFHMAPLVVVVNARTSGTLERNIGGDFVAGYGSVRNPAASSDAPTPLQKSGPCRRKNDPNRSSEQSRLRRAPTIGQAQPRDRYWRLLRCTLLHLERQHPPLPFAIDVRGGVTQQGSRMLLPGLGNHDLGGSENEG